MNQEQINEIRQFNRYYTSVLGVINKHFLNSEFTLPEGRILLELHHHQSVSPSQIIESLQIDKGYLSRILKKFKQNNLIVQTTSSTDSRTQKLSLTKKGTEAYLKLNASTDEHIRKIFKEIPDTDLLKLTESMNTIISITNKSNGNSSIINTTIADLPAIYHLYDQAIAYQKSRNFPVWNGYDKGVINDEIENRSQYKILINNQLAGIFSACQPGPVEAELWQERAEKKAIYLHRIIVNQDFKGQKIFAQILRWAEEFTAGGDYQYIRMDTWADNPTLIDYYKSFGFEEAGIGYTSDSENLPSQYRKVKIIMMEKTASHLTSSARPHISVADS